MNWKISVIFLAIILASQIILINAGFAMELIKSNPTNNTPVEKKAPQKPQFVGWLDQNKDGINDKFHDANGDGINDVTKEKYKHRFPFVDKNKDGINDVFVDKDGDGVNDLEKKFLNKDEDSIYNNILDYNKDGINDITGLKYKKDDLMGYRYGIVEEELNTTHKKFIDENGDGMHDSVAKRMRFQDENADGINDQFVDENGDGICDGRRFMLRQRRFGQQGNQDNQQGMQKGQQGKQKGGGKGK